LDRVVSSRVGDRRSVQIVTAAIGVLLLISIVAGGAASSEPKSGSTGVRARQRRRWVSHGKTLGHGICSVPGTPFCFRSETRVQDFEAFVRDTTTTLARHLPARPRWAVEALRHSWRNPDFPQTTNLLSSA
jgi:hypothetical protein